MTFIEAAIFLLREAGRPMAVDELCELAIERDLLTNPGKTPGRSMKAQLTTELKKGGESRVVSAGTNVWALRESEAAEGGGGASGSAPWSPYAADEPAGDVRRTPAAVGEPGHAPADAAGEPIAGLGDDEYGGAADPWFGGAEEDDDDDEDEPPARVLYAGDELDDEEDDDEDVDEGGLEGDEGEDDVERFGTDVDDTDDVAAAADAPASADVYADDDAADEDDGDQDEIDDGDDGGDTRAATDGDIDRAPPAVDAVAGAGGAGTPPAEGDTGRPRRRRRGRRGGRGRLRRAEGTGALAAAGTGLAAGDAPLGELDPAAAAFDAADDGDQDDYQGETQIRFDDGADTEPEPPGPPLSPEELALRSLYEEELAPASPTDVHEYRDHQSADEDRPLRPELLPPRDAFGRSRGMRHGRDDLGSRGGRRERRGRGERARRANGEREVARDVRPSAAEARPLPVDLCGAGAFELADAAFAVLAGRDDQRPVSARQLADIMTSRRLLERAPEEPWRALKAALLHDERVRRAGGLRPRIVYRGKDTFALGRAGLEPAVAAGEDRLERAAAEVSDASRAALQERLARVPLGVLERIANIYLQRAGWRQLTWIKRVDRSAYATGAHPATGDAHLIGVRIGPERVDRRGVGELRAGVLAKGAVAGLLLSPTALSEEAERERANPGAPVTVLCGAQLAAALAALGIGVVPAAVAVVRLDAEFFAELAQE
jgi:hypothetical protein